MGVHEEGRIRIKMAFYLSFSVLKKIISFNIKNLKLYSGRDSFNKLKGVIYGVGYTCRNNRNSVLFESIKIFEIN